MSKIVLAYSGGLDTSIIIPWLKENYDNAEIIAVCADVGQGKEVETVKERALASGASKVYVSDLREKFVEDFVFPVLRSGALYEGAYLMGTACARPLISKELVRVAQAEGADYICHGCTGKGNDQVRFELTIKALSPETKIIAPWRIWDIRSREEQIDYAEAHHIEVPVTKKRPYSMDRNIMHLSHEGADLEDPANEPMADLTLIVTRPEDAPDQAEYVTIDYKYGDPVALNGEPLAPLALLEKANDLAAKHGIGVIDIVENRLVGMKSRGVYESPGATLLYFAHKQLESLTLDRSTMAFKATAAQRYGELVYDGLWYTPLRQALDAFFDETQKNVTGQIEVKMYKGGVYAAGMSSPYSLYNEEYSTFGEDEVYNQGDAQGFINLFGLPLQVHALMQEKVKNLGEAHE